MASKTVILRPISSAWGVISSGSGFVPSDTAEENAYLLVSESEADDDTTYIHFTNAMSTMYFGIGAYDKGNIKGLRVHIRARGLGTERAFSVYFQFRGTNGDSANSTSINPQSEGDGWHDYILDWSDSVDDLALFNNAIYEKCGFYITGGANSGGKTDVVADITQVYLELTYEDPENTTTPIYLRENGVWVAVEGTVYRKENGAWVQSDTDVFAEGDKFTLVTV